MYRVLLVLLLLVTMFSVQTVFAQDESDGDALADGEYSAVISAGPAFIRADASPDGDALGRCPTGQNLTIWLPAVDEWLTSSCLGVNGYIHNSLVEIGEMVVPEESMMEDEESMMEEDDSMMEEEAMEEESMMEEDDSMMEEEAMEEEPAAGEYTAVISKGPARIRTEASLEGEILGLCPRGQGLTVWLPAVDEWLTSSCLGLTGFIHSSLVEVGDAVVPEEAMEEEAMMEDDSMMEEEAMEEDDSMMEEEEAMEEEAMEEDDSMMEEDTMMGPGAGAHSAVINAGPAFIRAAASMDGEVLGRCSRGQDLTVWLPATDGWLLSSCLNVNGYIHESLVDVGDPIIPEIEDLGDSDGEEMAMEESEEG